MDGYVWYFFACVIRYFFLQRFQSVHYDFFVFFFVAFVFECGSHFLLSQMG